MCPRPPPGLPQLGRVSPDSPQTCQTWPRPGSAVAVRRSPAPRTRDPQSARVRASPRHLLPEPRPAGHSTLNAPNIFRPPLLTSCSPCVYNPPMPRRGRAAAMGARCQTAQPGSNRERPNPRAPVPPRPRDCGVPRACLEDAELNIIPRNSTTRASRKTSGPRAPNSPASRARRRLPKRGVKYAVRRTAPGTATLRVREVIPR